jgi:hypothetical protein
MAERAPAFAAFAKTLSGRGLPAEVVIELFNLAWRSGFTAGCEGRSVS